MMFQCSRNKAQSPQQIGARKALQSYLQNASFPTLLTNSYVDTYSLKELVISDDVILSMLMFLLPLLHKYYLLNSAQMLPTFNRFSSPFLSTIEWFPSPFPQSTLLYDTLHLLIGLQVCRFINPVDFKFTEGDTISLYIFENQHNVLTIGRAQLCFSWNLEVFKFYFR